MKKIILLLLTVSLSSYGQVFTDVTGSIAQLKFGFLTWGDYDADGDLDLYYTGELDANNNGGGLYINDNGTFTLSGTSNLPLLNTGAADTGDFNADGYPDIVVMGADITSYNGHTDIFINNGDGTFTALNAGLPDAYMGDVKFFDSDADGDVDVLITGFDNAYNFFAKLFVNDSGVLTEDTTTTFPELNYGRIAIADYDADGDVDIALNGMNNPTSEAYTKIWKNEGNNVFTEQSLGFAQLWLGDMEFGDVDNDGDLDFVFSGTAQADSEVHLMLNDNGSFTEDTNFDIMPAHRGFGLELADFDVDGYLDIFIVGTHYLYIDANNIIDERIAKLYINDRSGGFVEDANNIFSGVEFCESNAADYDNDGKVDLFYTGIDDNDFSLAKLYHNDTIAGMAEAMSEHFEIYPNPVLDVLHIRPLSADNFQVQIIDLTGKVVYNKTSNTDLDIRFSNYSQGIYFVKITENNKTYTQKLIH